MHLIKAVFTIVIGLFAMFGVRPAFAVDILKYSQATKTALMNQRINIDYGTKMFKNRRMYSPLLSINNLLPKGQAKTSLVKGFNKSIIDDVLVVPGAVTVGTVAGAEQTITLTGDDKHNLIENQIIKFEVDPTDTAYTTEFRVSDKLPTHATDIKIIPSDVTKKSGIAALTDIPAGTLINCLAPRFNQNSRSVEPVSTEPSVFSNYVQEMRWPYEFSEIAAKENLYAPTTADGTLRSEKDKEAKEVLLALAEKAVLMNGKAIKVSSSKTSTVEYGQMRGIREWLKQGEDPDGDGTYQVSPAVFSYTAGAFDLAKFESWIWELGSPDLEEHMLLVFTNRAGAKFLTDQKKNNQAWTWEKVPTNTYGIPFITQVDIENVHFELKIHPALDRIYSNKVDPVFMALTAKMIEIEYMIPWQLRNSIQENDATGYKAEYYVAMTSRLYNAHTAYHGFLWPDEIVA